MERRKCDRTQAGGGVRSAAEHETPAKNGHKNKSAEGTIEFLPPLRGLRGDKHSTHLCLLQYLLTFFDIVSKTMN